MRSQTEVSRHPGRRSSFALLHGQSEAMPTSESPAMVLMGCRKPATTLTRQQLAAPAGSFLSPAVSGITVVCKPSAVRTLPRRRRAHALARWCGPRSPATPTIGCGAGWLPDARSSGAAHPNRWLARRRWDTTREAAVAPRASYRATGTSRPFPGRPGPILPRRCETRGLTKSRSCRSTAATANATAGRP